MVIIRIKRINGGERQGFSTDRMAPDICRGTLKQINVIESLMKDCRACDLK